MTTPIAWKIITTANCSWSMPFETQPIVKWNDTVGSAVTATVCGTVNAGSLPNNDDIWAEFEYIGSAGGVVDPYFGSVILLVDAEGLNTSTTVLDKSTASHTMTAVGGAQISTAQFRFGASSLVFNGTTSYVTSPDSPDWLFAASQPFTIEFSARWFGDPTSFQVILGHWLSSGSQRSWAIDRDGISNLLRFVLSSDGASTAASITASFIPTLGTWYTIAVDFNGTKYRLYLNGSMIGSTTTLVTPFNSTASFSIGAQSDASFPFNGWLDEIRITKGVARYASDAGYTVATAAFPLTSSAGPLGTFATTTKSDLLASSAAVASDSSTWGGGGAGWSPFKLVATFTPQIAGWIYARVRVGKPSATYYIDPKVTLT